MSEIIGVKNIQKALQESIEEANAEDYGTDPDWADAILEKVDEKLSGFGVEALREEGAWVDGYYMDIIGLYVNLGDTYTPTVVYDTEEGTFDVTSWGDFLEGWEQDHAESSEDDDGYEMSGDIPITATRLHPSGAWEVYATIDGQFKRRVYFDFTKEEAIEDFKDEMGIGGS